MPPKTLSKDVHEMWNTLYQVDLALTPTEYGASRSVKSWACRFYEVYSWEQDTDEGVVEETVLPLLTPEKTREWKCRKKTTNTHHWTKVCGDNIQKHHREQHAKKWVAYKILLQKKHTELEKLTAFFDELHSHQLCEYQPKATTLTCVLVRMVA